MSLKLAYLVIDRAPLRGVRYWSLLYVALSANERDIAYASGPAVAASIRVRLQRAQEALAALCDAGYLKRLRYGQARNRYDGYYIVRRETLVALPSQHGARRVFAGHPVEDLDRILTEETVALLADRAQLLDKFLTLSPGEHLAFLREIGAPDAGSR